MNDETNRKVIVGLTSGILDSRTLYSIYVLSKTNCELIIINAVKPTDISRKKRVKRLVRDYGIFKVMSRFLAAKIFQNIYDRKSEHLFDAIFNKDELISWWKTNDIQKLEVPHLNSIKLRRFLKEIEPDLIIRLSGGILRKGTFNKAKYATINIHHGIAPLIRGMWSIPWGIVEGRPNFIMKLSILK